MGNRRFLLISDLPPCQNYTGGIVLDSLMRHLPSNAIYSCVILNPGLRDAAFSSDLNIPHRFFPKPREHGGGIKSLLRELYAEFVQVPRLAREIAKIAAQEEITDLWCVLQGQTMVRLANGVADLTGLPLYTEVWDPIEWWLRDHHVNRVSKKRILADFDRAIRRSEGCAAASLPMAAAYREKYAVRALPVMHGLPATLKVASSAKPSDKIRIGISGQLYARAEFDQLLRVLDSVGWNFDGKKVEIHLFSRELSIKTDKELNILYRGWRTQERLIVDLAELDFLYCPYWFDPCFESEARNSFPSKITTYFLAGRPVLFHGPAYSSVALLFASENCGIACSDPSDIALLSAIRTIIGTATARDITRRADDVFNRLFSLDAQKQAFGEFLNLSF